MRLAPSRAISSSVSVISPACTEEVSVDSLSMGGVSFPPPASGVFVCWAHAEGYAALFHPIKSRDPQLLRIPPRSACRTQFRSVSPEQPIFSAIDWMAAHCEEYSLSCSNTIRTARSRTSGEYFFACLMTPILYVAAAVYWRGQGLLQLDTIWVFETV